MTGPKITFLGLRSFGLSPRAETGGWDDRLVDAGIVIRELHFVRLGQFRLEAVMRWHTLARRKRLSV